MKTRERIVLLAQMGLAMYAVIITSLLALYQRNIGERLEGVKLMCLSYLLFFIVIINDYRHLEPEAKAEIKAQLTPTNIISVIIGILILWFAMSLNIFGP